MAWCPWNGMIKLLCQGNDIPTNLQSKAGCLGCNPPFSSVLPKKSSSIHLRATVWKVKLKCFRNGTQCLKFGLGRRAFYFGLQPRLHVWESNRHSRSQQRPFVPIGSTRDTNKFHVCFVFSKRFYRFLYLDDQMISRWRIWPSTSKSTCVVPAWPRRGLLLGSVQADNRSNWPFTPRDVHLFKMNGKLWLACVYLSESSFGAIQKGVCVCHWKPAGLHAHVPLVKDISSQQVKNENNLQQEDKSVIEKVLSKNKQTQNLTKVYRTPELNLRLQRSDVSFHCPLARHLRANAPLALSYPTSQLMRTVAG